MEVTLTQRQLETLAVKIAEQLAAAKPARMLNTKEKARQLGISVVTLRRMAREGRIDSVKDGDNIQSRLVFREDSLPIR